MSKDVLVERHPVFLSEETMLLITVFHNNESWKSIFSSDYVDAYKEDEQSAKVLIGTIEEYASISFLQHLRKAIADEINSQNKQFNTNHSIDLGE